MIPPNAIVFLLKCLVKILNFTGPKNWFFFFILNKGEMNKNCTPCFFFSDISFKLCADPIIQKLFLLKFLGITPLLNDGIYTPSKFSFIASFRSFAKKNFLFFNLQIFFISRISFILYFLV